MTRIPFATIPITGHVRPVLPAVEFVGPMLPTGVDDRTPPDWWPELHGAVSPVARGRRTVPSASVERS
jgi:hypothetical protein